MEPKVPFLLLYYFVSDIMVADYTNKCDRKWHYEDIGHWAFEFPMSEIIYSRYDDNFWHGYIYIYNYMLENIIKIFNCAFAIYKIVADIYRSTSYIFLSNHICDTGKNYIKSLYTVSIETCNTKIWMFIHRYMEANAKFVIDDYCVSQLCISYLSFTRHTWCTNDA